MKCPYCGTTLNKDSLYCTQCGQEVVMQAKDDVLKKYWGKYHADKEKEKQEQIEKEENNRKQKKEDRKNNIAAIVALVIIVVVALIGVRLLGVGAKAVYSKIAFGNEKAIEQVREDMIGKTYERGEDQVLWSGNSVKRRIVTIIDEETLHFSEGNYIFRLTDDNRISYEEESIYINDTYAYEIKKSFGNRYKILFDGREYKLEMTEEGEVKNIELYKKNF